MDVLHVPYTYWPDVVGGTEIYVSALVQELAALGMRSGVAAPAGAEGATENEGVFRWRAGTPADAAYGRPDPQSAVAFREILSRAKPRIVHLHARSSAVSSLLLREAHAAGARTVFTYHAPSVSCMRGTMMLRGRRPCDGVLEGARCTQCVLQKQGVPAWAAAPLSHIPAGFGSAAAAAGFKGGPWLAFRMRDLVDDAQRDLREFLAEADRIVAVCDWVADVLRRNGVAEPRLVLNRQGIATQETQPETEAQAKGGPLRLAYFGRLDPAKGIDVLIRAVVAAADVELDVFSVSQGRDHAYARMLEHIASGHRNVRFRDHVPPGRVVMEMVRADIVAVPSTGLETGPLVVLEAFAAKRPVLGSRMGGIAEIIRDGVDGCLVAAGDVEAWVAAIRRLAGDRALLARLRAGVCPPRTMRDVAVEMSTVYAQLLAGIPRAA